MGVGPLSLGYATRPSTTRSARSSRTASRSRSCTRSRSKSPSWCASVVPSAETVRFSKTGCDVTSAAVRLARAFTGRDKVALLRLPRLARLVHRGHRSRSRHPEAVAGPDLHVRLQRPRVGARRSLDDDTACVILEPTVFEAPRDGFLAELRELCDARGALLIFDEMWTGFRHRARRRAGMLRRHAPISPASRRPSPTACRSRSSPGART